MADIPVRENLVGSGQHKVYVDGEERIRFPRMECTPVKHLTDEAPFTVHPKFADKEYVILSDVVKLIPRKNGLSSDMIDWWWANLEKGYFLWAPGEHYGFEWLVPPCDGGYMTVEASYEFDPCHPMAVTRRSIGEDYPLAECYEHVIMSTFETNPGEMILIHTWEDHGDDILWRDITMMEGRWYKEVGNVFAHLPEFPSHMDYEASRLPEFLPQLYALWQCHPDPWENPCFNLKARQREDGTWEHVSQNPPPSIDDVKKKG